MAVICRPMKAGPFVPEHVTYPIYGQPKYDGWRMLIHQATPFTSRLKEYPNWHLHNFFAALPIPMTQLLDGEVAVGDHLAPECYSLTESAVSSFHGEPNFTFFVFDSWDSTGTLQFDERYAAAKYKVDHLKSPRIKLVENRLLHSYDELLAYEEEQVTLGYEGIILKSPYGPYKQGRSTSRQCYSIKIKRWKDSEAEIIGYEELYSNQNEKQVNELGLTKRSSHAANMVPMDTLGALLAKDINPESPFYGVEFRVGVFKGLTKAQLKEIWDSREKYLGRPFKYQYQPVGGYVKPRIPTWRGWRGELLL